EERKRRRGIINNIRTEEEAVECGASENVGVEFQERAEARNSEKRASGYGAGAGASAGGCMVPEQEGQVEEQAAGA
ncbi:hypothetical protein ACLOJK_041091, partial [Asimina triloba]